MTRGSRLRTPEEPSKAFVPVLVAMTLVVSVVSSLGAPLLPSVATMLSTSLSGAQWSLTSALLAGAVAAPILGRLGDGPRRRGAIIGALVVVTFGGVLSGLASTLWLLILGRAMQGVGLGLVPIAMAAARDHVPGNRGQSTIALLSVSGAVGVGAGYPLSGLIDQQFDVHAAFFFGAILTAAALVAAYLVIPPSRSVEDRKLDLKGAIVGGAGATALLVGVGQGEDWGWLSPGVLASFAVAAAVLAVWARMELRTKEPLVDLTLLRHRTVLSANIAALLLGVALYMFLTIITEFVQTPASAGFGFGKSTLMAGVCLVPFSITGLLASRVLGAVGSRLETRSIVASGALAIFASGAFFAVVHDAYWQACLMMGILGIGFGFTFGAIPGVITRSIPVEEVGSAMGFYQVIRSTGFAIGSASVASIVAANSVPDSLYPTSQGYVVALWVGGAVSAAALAVALLLSPRALTAPPARRSPRPSPRPPSTGPPALSAGASFASFREGRRRPSARAGEAARGAAVVDNCRAGKKADS